MNFDNLELEAGYSKILLPKDFNISIHKLISIIKKGLTGEFEKEDYSLDQFGRKIILLLFA